MLVIITCVALGICCGIVLLIYNNIELLKTLALTISIFIGIYIIVSGFFFAFNRFSLFLSSCVTLFICFLIFAILIIEKIIKGKKIVILFDAKETIGIIVLCMAVFPIIFQRNGYFCMAQDEGGYYVKALYIGEGINDNILKASEFEIINSDAYSEYLQDSINDIVVGFHDPLHDLKYVSSSEVIENQYKEYMEGGYGRFHGIFTYSALLALFGRIFGYSNMGYLQLVTYYIYVILCFYTLKKIQINPFMKYTITFACAIIPPVVWCGKSYLTEMYLAVISIEILLFFLEDNLRQKTFTLIPVITFCFYHISAFVFIPLYYILYLYFFFQTKNKLFLLNNVVLIIGYLCGYIVNISMNLQYVVSNYNGHLSFMNLNSAKELTSAVFIIGILAVAFSIIIMIGKQVQKSMEIIWGTIYDKLPGIIKIAIVIMGAVSIYRSVNPEFVERTSLIAFICLSGIFVFVIGVLYFFLTNNICSDELFCISMNFLYCVILLSIFYQKLLPFYYGARYIAPYMSIIFIFAGMVFKAKRVQHLFFEMICLMSIKYMLIYDNVLAKHQDDTRVQTEVLLDIMDMLTADDFVFIEKRDYFAELYVPLKLAAQKVYYVKDNLDVTLSYINVPEEKRIIVISDQEIMEDKYREIVRFENHISMLADYREVFSDMLINAQDERMYKDEMGVFHLYEYVNRQ